MDKMAEKRSAYFIMVLAVGLTVFALYIYSPFLRYMLVAATLALATSHAFSALNRIVDTSRLPPILKRSKRLWISGLFTFLFLLVIFLPLIYFATVTFNQVSALDIDQVKANAIETWLKITNAIDGVPLLKSIFERLKTEGVSLLKGNFIEALLHAGQNMASGVGSLIIQIGWTLVFYFLFNLYGHKILHFLATLMPTSPAHERYLYRECTGTVAVVFYGALFNMIAQGIAFGLLISIIGGYDSLYLGVLAGFCSIIPLVGAALVYIPVTVLELLDRNFVQAAAIVIFAWVVMGFAIDNILRMVFIGFLRKLFKFQYSMNEVLILLSILAGIATMGFWGLVIGPSVTALAIASANLLRDYLDEDEHTPVTRDGNGT